MRKFIGGAAISREHLLKGKASALRKMAEYFLRDNRFDNKDGASVINGLLTQHGIENTDESVVAFVQGIVGDKIGILCFQTGPNDYTFNLVSGSDQDLERMSTDDSTSGDQGSCS